MSCGCVVFGGLDVLFSLVCCGLLDGVVFNASDWLLV